jgi:succinyl-diaminopimelate desuccinylase
MEQQFPDNVVELTQSLVRIPSENPTGDETALADYMKTWMEAAGLEVEVQPVEGKRSNVIGRLKGSGDSMPLVYMAHMDTVPTGDKSKWQHDPFAAEIEAEKIFGRGTCDMKGGAAAAMIAIRRIIQGGHILKGDLVLACTVDEEDTMKGIHRMGQAHTFGENAYLLAMEPTDLKFNVAQKGAYWFRIKMLGRGAHAANPQFGADANRAMAEAMLGWYELADRILPSRYQAHPLLGYPSLVVSKLQGGVKTNIVSEICNSEIDMRMPPGFNYEELFTLITEVGQKAGEKYGVTFEILVPSVLRHPVECEAGSPLIAAFEKAYHAVTGTEAVKEGFLAYTDAAMLAILTGNKHATVFGPGSLSDAHTTDEKVEIGQLYVAADVLERTALELLAG